MANKVQIRRGNFANLPVLSNGEPGLAEDVGKVYIGNGGSNLGVQMAPGAADYTVYVATAALGGLSQATQGATGLLLASGTTTATTANKLVDSTAAFTAALVNKTVYNATTDTWAKVTAVDSPTTLSLGADIFLTAQSYKVASAIDNIPEAFSTADSGFRANITIRVSPGTFADNITLIGKTAGDNKTLTLQGSTTGTTTISGMVTARQKITFSNLTFTNWIKAYFGADLTWNSCVTSGTSKLYHYEGNANAFNSSTIVLGNDPGTYIAISSTITKGYTMYVASATLGGSDATGDGLQMYSDSATSTSASKLIDSAANFGTDVVNKTLYNSTDDTWAKVTARDSATQLSLSADIMASGEAYVISNAFATVQKAVDMIPGTVNCNTTLQVSNGTYAEAVNVWGKNFSGSFSITVQGTRAFTVTGTATSGANQAGNGSAGFGTLTDTGKAWGVNAHQNLWVEITGGTGSGQIRPIHSNTATVLTIVGRWDTVPGGTSTYKIFSLATTIDGTGLTHCVKIKNGQQSINLKYLKMTNAFNILEPSGGSSWSLLCCHLQGGTWGINSSGGSLGSVTACVSRLNSLGDIIMDRAATISQVKRCRFTGSSTRSIHVAAAAVMYDLTETYIGQIASGGVGIYCFMGGVLLTDAYLEIDGCTSHGINLFANGVMFANGNYGAVSTQIIKNNSGWGVISASGGFGSGVSAITYSGNTSGTYTPTTATAGGNT